MDLLSKISPLINHKKCLVLVFNHGKKEAYSLFDAKRKMGELKLKQLVENTNEIDRLSVEIEKQKVQPVLLALFGDGIVQRIYPGNINDINTEIPNINPDEYYIDSHELEDERIIVALFRLKELEKLIGKLAEENVFVHHIFLGFVNIAKYKDSLEIGEGLVQVWDHFLQIEGTRVRGVGKKLNPDEKLSGESNNLKKVATAASLSFFLKFNTCQGLIPALVIENRKELLAEWINSVIIKFLLPGLLVMLVVNFLLLGYYEQEINRLSGNFINTETLSMKIEQLKKQIADEKEFHSQTKINNNRHFAYYIDRIASNSSPGIRFEKLTMNPLKRKKREKKMIEYRNGEIELFGTTGDEDSFSKFLVNIDSSSLDLSIGKQVYFYDNNKRKAKFEIVLGFSEETKLNDW